MYGRNHFTVCTGATVIINDDGKRVSELVNQVDSLKDDLAWHKRQLDEVREANHHANNVAHEHAEVMRAIRNSLDALGKKPEASMEVNFMAYLDNLLSDAGFPKVQLPAVITK